MDETLPVNDACSCVSKACSSTESMCTYMCWHTYRSEFSIIFLIFPQTHTKNVISTPPIHLHQLIYARVFCALAKNVEPEIWATSTQIVWKTHHWQPAMGPRWFVSSAPPQPIRIFGLEQNHQPLLRSLKPLNINYTGEKGPVSPPLFQ